VKILKKTLVKLVLAAGILVAVFAFVPKDGKVVVAESGLISTQSVTDPGDGGRG
jgi:hypothetical protein